MPSRSLLDLVLVLVGVFLLAFAPVTYLLAPLSQPDVVATVVDVGVTAVLSVGVGIWYWRTGRPLGALGMYFFWTMAFVIGLGIPGMAVLDAVGVKLDAGSVEGFTAGAALLVAAYAAGYVFAYRGVPSRSLLDLLFSLGGVFLLAFTPIAYVASAVMPPDVGSSLVGLAATGAVAVAVGGWYWRTGRPVGALGMYFFWTMALWLVLGIPSMAVLAVLDASFRTGSVEGFLAGATLLVAVYAGGYVLGYRDGYARLRRRVG